MESEANTQGGLTVLLLGLANPVIEQCIRAAGDSVIRTETRIDADSETLKDIDFLVSFGYRHILPGAVLARFGVRAINIHVSMLPWNRGADPNLWSFVDNTPKGVTIHVMDEGIDTGPILVQREVEMGDDETLATSYAKLQETAEALLCANWPAIRMSEIDPRRQAGEGSVHRAADKAQVAHLLTAGWATPVSCLRMKHGASEMGETMHFEASIFGRAVGPATPPFVIAEMSGNHNHSLERALEIVDAAADAGAHALKIQTYTADTLTLDVDFGEFVISDPNSLWAGRSLHALYEEAHTPWEWHAPIFNRARERGMIAFSTPFDESAVDFLETLDVPCYKIASFENVHIPLIRKVAATGKPIIMSTGMATAEELDEAVTAARGAGCKDLILLKCTSTYPASPENSNLLTIPDMRKRYGCPVGLSDHTMGVGVAVAAVALGAVAIEKHFTLRRADGGVDSAFSLGPEELAELVRESERAWQALGGVSYGPTDAEKASVQFRRSLYIAQDMEAGDVFTAENLRVVRPGLGLAPKYYDEVLGKRVARNAAKGTALTWDLVER